MGRSRGGLTSKIHAVVDGNGLPVRLALSPGEAHDNRLAGKLLSRLKSGSMLLADRGYDADWIRELAMKKGAWANIPPKTNRSDPICFSPYLYPARNQVERFFALITQRAIRRGSFESTADLVKKIDRYIHTHNANSQPFVWTATADAILQKLARLCQRISGTEH